MPTPVTTKRQYLNVRSSSEQMEMRPDSDLGSNALSEDFEGKLKFANEQLESLQRKREELEVQRRELEELNARKEEFLERQIENNERLSSALTIIDRELFEMRQEVEDLEQTRTCFANNMERISKLDPQNWRRDNLGQELNKAISALDQAEAEYEDAVVHFSGARNRLFGSGKSKRHASASSDSGFSANLRNGFAFNLPLILFGILAILIYISKAP